MMIAEESRVRGKQYLHAWAEAGAFVEQERRERVRPGDGGLDWCHIQEQLRPLAGLKEPPAPVSQLLALRERLHYSET